MRFKRVTYVALGAFLSAVSCSREAAERDVYDRADGKIYFKPSISDVSTSRAQDMTLERLESFQVTCFNTTDFTKNAYGFVDPYFPNAKFVRNWESVVEVAYVSPPDQTPYKWPDNSGTLKFYAFAPSLATMREGNSPLDDIDDSSYFRLINTSSAENFSLAVSYRLGTIRINPDISRQFDFITAEASGQRFKEFASGVALAFSHRLCQVELKAWGGGTEFNFDIAGIRIGNPVVEGVYLFADEISGVSSPGWEIDDDALKERVEYLYRGSDTSDSEAEPLSADKIFRINSNSHNSSESAASIMGEGGCAMVIPTVNPRWEALEDPDIDNVPYATGRMYFSILMRVTSQSNGQLVYPYPGDKSGRNMVSYAVDSSDHIVRRLYAGETEGSYFTDSGCTHEYKAPEGIEIMDFAWAAVPVDADWKAGKKYIYTLDYSEGIGLHDPDDPDPGHPIAGEKSISWGVSVDKWEYAEKDKAPADVSVPRR